MATRNFTGKTNMQGSISGIDDTGKPFEGSITMNGDVAGQVEMPDEVIPPTEGMLYKFVQGEGINIQQKQLEEKLLEVTVTNISPDKVVNIVQGPGIKVSGNYPNFIIENTGQGSGGGSGTSMFDEGWINVQDYGAVPGQDCTQAFKAAVQAAMANGHHKIWIPASNQPYIITDTIVFPGNFRAWTVKGAGIADEGALNEHFTKMLWRGTQGPCFNFVAVRLADIDNFVIEATNTKPIEVLQKYKRDTRAWNPEFWVNNNNSIDKKNHQSGIAFDWGIETPPWGAQTQIRRVKITNCVVAFSISPSISQQADTIWFRDCKVEHCVYAASIAQDQCRAITFENMWVNNTYCAFVNNKFGKGNGSAFNVFGGQFTTCFKLFECTNAYRGQCSINGIFSEACGLIGGWQPLGINNNPVAFTGCEFGLDNNGWNSAEGEHWTTPLATFESVGLNAVFTGCTFNSRKKLMGFNGGTFIGCSFNANDELFFSVPLKVSVSGDAVFEKEGNTGNYSSFKYEDEVAVHESHKWYVRPEVKVITNYTNTQGVYPKYKRRFAELYVPTWYEIVWKNLPQSDSDTFTWTLQPHEAAQFMIGDYMNGYVGSTLGISGMGMKFGQVMVPAYVVTAVDGNNVTFRKTSPEMAIREDITSGSIYNGWKAFVTGVTIEVLEDGEIVSVKNSHRLNVGDIVNVNNEVVRVLEIGNKVKFSKSILKGTVKSVI